jgi:hypothetical protein
MELLSAVAMTAVLPTDPIRSQIWENQIICQLQEELRTHPLYDDFRDLEDARIFMESHVFAVWDFMSLLKALQNQLTGSKVPWIPASNARICQLINELVLTEESDAVAGGFSHFEWYLDGMEQAGANIEPILRVLRAVDSGLDSDEIWRRIPAGAADFVRRTLSVARYAPDHVIAAEFVIGRENLIPEVFPALLSNLAEQNNERLDILLAYLKRHIEIDGNDHGAYAQEVLRFTCQGRENRIEECVQTAIKALQARIALWDDIHRQIRWRRSRNASAPAP